MSKYFLLMLIALLSAGANATPKTIVLKNTEVTQAVGLDTLSENCEAIKRMATTAIDLRYTNASLKDVNDQADIMFADKSDTTYRNLFKMIAKDAFQEPKFTHPANKKSEMKAFIDRNFTICKTAYSQL